MTTGEINKPVKIVRWIAKVLAVALAAMLMLFFIGEAATGGINSLTGLSLGEFLMFLTLLGVLAGLLLGLKWELFGGVLTIGSMAAFYLLDYLFTGDFPDGPFFLILISPSFLFLYLAFKVRPESGSSNNELSNVGSR